MDLLGGNGGLPGGLLGGELGLSGGLLGGLFAELDDIDGIEGGFLVGLILGASGNGRDRKGEGEGRQ